MTEKRDYYEILGIGRNASEEDIKRGYRRMAMKYHPDRNPGDEESVEHFKQAVEAYEVLIDPEKRSIYDHYGHEGLRETGFQGFWAGEAFSSLEDILEHFFGFAGGSRSRRRAREGVDLQHDLRIGFLEAAFGVEKEIEVQKLAACSVCGGSGVKRGYSRGPCRTCGGRGQVIRSQGFLRVAVTCPNCRGTGQVIMHPCEECKGSGRVRTKERISVKVPPGVEDGMSLRLNGKGEIGHSGGAPGDLYVRIHVEEHEFFRRKGDDVISRLQISFADAALGATREVLTLEGSEKVRIPKGTQPGHQLRLKGKGIPRLRGSGRGDQIIIIEVRIPARLTRKQERLLRELSRLEHAARNEKPISGAFSKEKTPENRAETR